MLKISPEGGAEVDICVLEERPSNKSITEAAPEEVALAETEDRDERPSNTATGDLSPWLDDNMSGLEKLVCIGGGASMDKRSNRASAPLLGARAVPKNP